MKKANLISLESEYKGLLEKYLIVINDSIKIFDKNISISIENYAYVLSHKIVSDLDNNYELKVDLTIINDGIIQDMKKVLDNYNTSNKSNLINFSIIEDTIIDNNLSNKEKCKKIDDYLRTIKNNYMMETNFISKLNETFTKRIMARILGNNIDLKDDKSKNVINEIYASVKNETFGFVNSINDSYVDMLNRITSITKKISEGMAQLEMLNPYVELENETELEFTSRISRLRSLKNESYEERVSNEE